MLGVKLCRLLYMGDVNYDLGNVEEVILVFS